MNLTICGFNMSIVCMNSCIYDLVSPGSINLRVYESGAIHESMNLSHKALDRSTTVYSSGGGFFFIFNVIISPLESGVG